ncbi:ArdC family protein, partial [Acidithiobacillus sp.]|uniref:ArdC family protein n=1 Tax=Acidithiobacillus sp. TaxID=1872118 RepID=UPI003D006AE8
MASIDSGKERRDLRLEVANQLIERIESGTATWQRPWEAGQVLMPVNAITGKPYNGVNRQNLMMFSPDLSDPRWCTYKQAQEQGWQVRKGSTGLTIEKWSDYEHRRTEEEVAIIRKEVGPGAEIAPTERRLGVRYYTVFHASQMEGIPPLERPERNHEVDGVPDPRLDGLAEALGVEVRRGGSRAFYRPREDFVQMPNAADFHTAVGHDTTFLHELSHATGHEHRLNRELGNSFGSEKYALEELRAEMSASMTAASLGIGFDPASQDREEGREMGNSAAYLASWLKALPEKERKQSIVQAIKDAQGISDYLIERTPE